MEAWNGFQGGALPVVFHALAMGIGAAICLKGISSIERANKVLVPALLVVVVVSVIRAVSLPGAGEGIGYLFSVDLDQLTRPQIWLEALTQNAWDTGAGWGLILTYAAYMQHRHGVVKNAFITGVGNNMVSMMAAVMVFGIVFATLSAEMTDLEILSIMQNSGPASTGLTFIWMPQLFARMTFGPGLAVLFFLGLSFAALSSLISMIELATRICVDAGLTRTRAIGLVAGGGFVLGVPSALNVEFLGNQDFVWGVALMLSGAFIALAVRSHGAAELAERIAAGVSDDWRAGAWWRTVILYLVPLQAVVLLVWWMYLSATAFAPDRWFDPFDPYSVMTCLVQWGAAIAVFLVMNKRLASRSVSAV
jgi:NSS family neurotransmitter:Na+ symporter